MMVRNRSKCWMQKTTRWWFRIFVYFHLYLGKNPILTIIFFKRLETNPTQPNPTNQRTSRTMDVRWHWSEVIQSSLLDHRKVPKKKARTSRRHGRGLWGMEVGGRDRGWVFPIFGTLFRKGNGTFTYLFQRKITGWWKILPILDGW